MKVGTEPVLVSELHKCPGSHGDSWPTMLRIQKHLGGWFLDPNAFSFLWMLESEQPIYGRLLDISHFSAQGRWKPGFGLSSLMTDYKFALPQALCQSFVILIPPIFPSYDSSLLLCPTIPLTDWVNGDSKRCSHSPGNTANSGRVGIWPICPDPKPGSPLSYGASAT